MTIQNHPDPIPAIERATAAAMNLYNRISQTDDDAARAEVLLLLAHLRHARKEAQ